MPYLTVTSNQALSPEKEVGLAEELSRRCTDWLGKSEAYVMVVVKSEVSMIFAGSAEPAAFAELFSIGLPAEEGPRLSEALCGFIGKALNVPEDRIYLNFHDAPREQWGWNGGTFGK